MLGKLSSFCRGFSTTPLSFSLFRSKKPWTGSQVSLLVPKGPGSIENVLVRHHRMIPRTQYDMISPGKFFNPLHMLIRHWELAPIFAILFYDMGLLIFFTVWAYLNKVDVMWTHPHDKRTNISRTMNLRCPTIHKLMVMEPSVYRPWPEMQDVLDGMAKAEAHLAIMASLQGIKEDKNCIGKDGSKGGGGEGLCASFHKPSDD